MYIVRFTKLFVSGTLKGLTYDSSLDFQSLDDAARYLAFLHRHIKKPVDVVAGSQYTCHCARIESD